MNEVLSKYVSLINFLSKVMGENCEIVLQDTSEDVQAIIAIANGNVSGRQVGSPLTDFGLKIIAEGTWKNCDYICNYIGKTKDGRVLRSSTYLIKDEGELLGMLCINSDTGAYKKVCEEILALSGLTFDQIRKQDETSAANAENFTNSIVDTIADIMKKLLGGDCDIPLDRLKQKERILIIKELEKQGVFLLKGAVSTVASCFRCSEATVYRYLNGISKEKKRISDI
jgi:predicted transcriptional regulator YheO